MSDLRRRDLEQHEGPTEPGWTHRDPGPTEDGPNPGPLCQHWASACLHTYETSCTPDCDQRQDQARQLAERYGDHGYTCRNMPMHSCPGTTGCPVLCARLDSDDPAPWEANR